MRIPSAGLSSQLSLGAGAHGGHGQGANLGVLLPRVVSGLLPGAFSASVSSSMPSAQQNTNHVFSFGQGSSCHRPHEASSLPFQHAQQSLSGSRPHVAMPFQHAQLQQSHSRLPSAQQSANHGLAPSHPPSSGLAVSFSGPAPGPALGAAVGRLLSAQSGEDVFSGPMLPPNYSRNK